MNGRTCIVTRQTRDADDLIRFVAGPDGAVVPDLKRGLPGRGCWVTAERRWVEKAVQRRLFDRALKSEVAASPDLPGRVDRLLADSVFGMIGMARKAGQFVSGAVRVEEAVRARSALAVFHASDAAADGVRKIAQAAHAALQGGEPTGAAPVFRLFSAAEIDDALGESAFIHAAALAGQAGEGVVKRAILLARYRGDGLLADANGHG